VGSLEWQSRRSHFLGHCHVIEQILSTRRASICTSGNSRFLPEFVPAIATRLACPRIQHWSSTGYIRKDSQDLYRYAVAQVFARCLCQTRAGNSLDVGCVKDNLIDHKKNSIRRKRSQDRHSRDAH
jgi:hypothetical protein